MNKFLGRALLSVCLGGGVASLAIGQTTTHNLASATTPAPTTKSEHHWFSHKTQAERTEARLNKVKVDLKITPAQEAQWTAYANVVRQTAQERDQVRNSHESRKQRPNAIEGLEMEKTLSADTGVKLDKLLSVEKPLYASLTPEQQKVADKVLNKPFGKHGRKFAFGFGHGHEGTHRG